MTTYEISTDEDLNHVLALVNTDRFGSDDTLRFKML